MRFIVLLSILFFGLLHAYAEENSDLITNKTSAKLDMSVDKNPTLDHDFSKVPLNTDIRHTDKQNTQKIIHKLSDKHNPKVINGDSKHTYDKVSRAQQPYNNPNDKEVVDIASEPKDLIPNIRKYELHKQKETQKEKELELPEIHIPISPKNE